MAANTGKSTLFYFILLSGLSVNVDRSFKVDGNPFLYSILRISTLRGELKGTNVLRFC